MIKLVHNICCSVPLLEFKVLVVFDWYGRTLDHKIDSQSSVFISICYNNRMMMIRMKPPVITILTSLPLTTSLSCPQPQTQTTSYPLM